MSTTSRMKTVIAMLGLLTLILMFFPGNTYAAQHTQSVRGENFRMLDQHGEWIENSRFGRVWRPHVAAGWRPFLYGEWDLVDGSWFWDSYEPFGWIVYHYGNWDYIPGTGWVWIPGYDWSPAQVSWIDFDDYVGWAPLPPAGLFWPNPWDFGPVVYWNVVLIRDFHHLECDRHVIRTPIPKPHDGKQIVRNAPEVSKIETVAHTKIENLKTKNTSVQDGQHALKQAELPKEHLHQTQVFRDRIRREVLAPKMATVRHR